MDITACPLCGSRNIAEAIKATLKTQPTTSFSVIPTNDFVTYWRCECGVYFQNPRKTDDEIAEYYSSGEYRKTIGIQGDNDAGEQRRADSLIEFLRQQNLTRFSHLDIGCSRGYFLEATRDRLGACPIAGTELLQDYTLPGIPLLETPVGRYGLVSAIHVLEHCAHPREELQSWAEHVETDGYLLIEVPGERGPWGLPHLFYFTPDVMKKMILDLGFTIVAAELYPHTRILAKC